MIVPVRWCIGRTRILIQELLMLYLYIIGLIVKVSWQLGSISAPTSEEWLFGVHWSKERSVVRLTLTGW